MIPPTSSIQGKACLRVKFLNIVIGISLTCVGRGGRPICSTDTLEVCKMTIAKLNHNLEVSLIICYKYAMTKEVAGVNLRDLEAPIYDALTRFSEETDGRVLFGYLEQAAQLELTPDKPNSARSSVPVYHEYEEAGTLHVIAFAPHDATGDDKTYTADRLVNRHFPDDPRYYPRSKANAHAEAHLSILSQRIESHDDPVLFAGHLSLLGIFKRDYFGTEENHLVEIGYVGMESHSFASAVRDGRSGTKPRATLTTGYRGELEHPEAPGERFGDPHALLNRSGLAVQVAGFIAISPEAAPKHLEVLRQLKAREPFIGDF